MCQAPRTDARPRQLKSKRSVDTITKEGGQVWTQPVFVSEPFVDRTVAELDNTLGRAVASPLAANGYGEVCG